MCLCVCVYLCLCVYLCVCVHVHVCVCVCVCLTVVGGASQDGPDLLVGGVLAQSAHDVGHLAEGHLAVTDSVEETEGLLEVWRGEREERGSEVVPDQ